MVESLERDEALRRHLTSNVAHELRTPLAVLKANLEAVADGVMEPDSETLSGLTSEVERLINLVRGIEDFTRAEASFFKPAQYEEVNLGEFVEGVLLNFRPLYQEKSLSLTLEGEGDLQAVIDIEKVEIVLRNLLSNALRHTEQGGIALRMEKAGKEGFSLTVTDTGSGITPDEQENIFKRFYKGESSTGVGLGLAIAREIVGIMGGSISVQSEKDKGSSFVVKLPIKPEEARI